MLFLYPLRRLALILFAVGFPGLVQSLTLNKLGSNPDINPYHNSGWVPRELLSKRLVDELVPRVCKGTYLPLFRDVGEPGELALTADELEAQPNGVATLSGNVTGVAERLHMLADSARLDRPNHLVELYGNVRIYEQDLMLSGDYLKINTRSGALTFDNIEYVRGLDRAIITTKLLKRDVSGIFHLKDATYTTCEPGNKSWHIYGNQLDFDYAKGWGTVVHAVLFIGDVPVFYFPWFRFPLDDRRHTGLLVPGFSTGSKNGFTLTQPLYLNLGANYDATLIATSFEKRGVNLETEGRLLTSYGTNSVSYSSMNDSLYGQTREKSSFQHEGGYNLPLRSSINYTRVLDPNYYDDLKFTFISGSSDLLDQYATLGVAYSSIRTTLGYYDYQPLKGYNSKVFARLPELDIDFSRQSGVFRFDLDSSYSDFIPRRLKKFSDAEKDNGDMISGERDHIEFTPGLYIRRVYGYLDLFIHQQYTNYSLANLGEDSVVSRSPSRSIHSKVNRGGLIFDRKSNFFSTPYTQTLQLDVQLLSTPYTNQDDIPNFTSSEPGFTYSSVFALDRFNGVDRVGDTKQFSYGASTKLLDNNGVDFFRFEIGQIKYAAARKVTLASNHTSLTKSIRYTREFSPIGARTTIALPQNWQLTNDLVWDQRISRNLLNRWNFQQTLGSRSFFNLGYNLVANEITEKTTSVVETEQASASGVVQVTGNWAFFGRTFYDINKNTFIERLTGAGYDSCCWRVLAGQFIRTDFDEEGYPEERGVFLQVHLKGLFGGQTTAGKAGIGDINSALEEAIPGFNKRKLYLPD